MKTGKQVDKASLLKWVSKVQQMVDTYNGHEQEEISIEGLAKIGGEKVLRIISTATIVLRGKEIPQRAGVYCFIDMATGDILKADGWSRLAKNPVRGNIFDSNPLAGVTPMGAKKRAAMDKEKLKRLHNIAVNEKNEGAYQQAIELEEILHGDLEEKAKELEKELHQAFAIQPDLHLLEFELWKKREGTWEKPRQGIIELVVKCTHPKSGKGTELTLTEKRKRQGFRKARAKRIGNVVWGVFDNFTNGFAKVTDVAEVEEVQEDGTLYILDMNYLYHFKLVYGQYD